ncbi:nuclear transport factor 2 family protein [Phreatobacter stygius]|uniref:Nuclear transport factor 2 family protein n=1 Tax=Phreatobacter stygius TaxID=1940610 RepID=A0A4D7ATQ5_9HYPH|nr:nuclear transport factor 2 family protein [Phreatobacter stygius]QCI64289.1 nuclear transport factor 2 family protein [Phreatobacter stygius]
MPSRETVEKFIAIVEANEHVRAIEEFYTEDASMQENTQAPRVGRDLLVAHEAAVLKRIKMNTHKVTTFLVDGDHVAINWVFEMTGPDGVTRKLDELALQLWRGDKIFRERFFYDPAALGR